MHAPSPSKTTRYRPRILCDPLLRYFFSFFFFLFLATENAHLCCTNFPLKRRFCWEMRALRCCSNDACVARELSPGNVVIMRHSVGSRLQIAATCVFSTSLIHQASSKLQSCAMRGPQFSKARIIYVARC